VHTLRDERRLENQLERLPRPVVLPAPAGPSPQQRQRMLVALGVLLVALFAVVLKEWDFWFPPRTDGQDASYTPSKTKSPLATADKTAARSNHNRRSARPAEAVPAAEPPPAVKAERTALPPMSVEVVSGNRHSVVASRNTAVNVDMSAGSTPPLAQAPSNAVVSAADRVQLSQQTTQTVTKSVAPDYPMLARQMKVQGAVVLQALISREGSIQELQVLSGPSILAAAAREAVRQWRFKPYFQNGEAVETQARITVNFTISTN
jgi:TonB family protein